MIENNFFPATKPMRYLLNAFRKRLTAIPCKLDSAKNNPQSLLPEQIPEVQSLRIHQKVIDSHEIGDTNY
jgi:hypothetical protein